MPISQRKPSEAQQKLEKRIVERRREQIDPLVERKENLEARLLGVSTKRAALLEEGKALTAEYDNVRAALKAIREEITAEAEDRLSQVADEVEI